MLCFKAHASLIIWTLMWMLYSDHSTWYVPVSLNFASFELLNFFLTEHNFNVLNAQAIAKNGF
jgi:hypothetical protein